MKFLQWFLFRKKPKIRSVLKQFVDCPDEHILEAYVERGEIIIKIRRKYRPASRITKR